MAKSVLRAAVLAGLAGLCACGDPGPRDRCPSPSARAWTAPSGVTGARRPRKRRHAAPSILGLASDSIAHLYPDDAILVVRFESLAALNGEPARQLGRIADTLPQLGLPRVTGDRLLHDILELGESVVIDHRRPFAFVRVAEGWVGIIPTPSHAQGSLRVKPLDALYRVAGDPQLVQGFQSGFRKGFHIPGDCSVIASPEGWGRLGTLLGELLDGTGLDPGFLDAQMGPLPRDVERVDLALRFGPGDLRVDLRFAPNGESATSLQLDRMKPVTSETVRWLPAGGSLYLELGSPVADWEALLQHLWPDATVPPRNEIPTGLTALRKGLGQISGDASLMLDLEPNGSGSIHVVAALEDPRTARDFLGSGYFRDLLAHVAGPGGRLEWMPRVLVRSGVSVGAVTGHLSRVRLRALKDGDPLEATLATHCRGPVVAYVAIVRDKLCILVGQHGRDRIQALVDRILAGEPTGNEHRSLADGLLKPRLAAGSADLLQLFRGSLEAAPLWHVNGRALRELELRSRIPVAFAVTVRGGALQLAMRAPPQALASAFARITEALD